MFAQIIIIRLFYLKITNAWDILNSIKANMSSLSSQTLEQAIFVSLILVVKYR